MPHTILITILIFVVLFVCILKAMGVLDDEKPHVMIAPSERNRDVRDMLVIDGQVYDPNPKPTRQGPVKN